MSPEPSPLGLALGRLPTGLYIVSVPAEPEPVGFVGSFVMQVAFEPPSVCVAIKQGRAHLDAIRCAGRFGISILDEHSQGAMKAFFKKSPDGQGPFAQLPFTSAPGGAPLLDSALAVLDCRWTGEYVCGDHVVVFGAVEAGRLQRAGDPSVHLRRDGLGY